MNAMFKEIRHGEINKVRARIEKNPAVVNEYFDGKAPKKDIAQSPLQVAIKVGEFEIIDLLIENGADVDFREDPAVTPPYTTCMPLLDDAIIGAMDSLLYGVKNLDKSEKYVKLIGKLLEKGADPDKKTIPFVHPNGKYMSMNEYTPFIVLLTHAKENIDRYTGETYPGAEALLNASKKALFDILDLLKKYGADIEGALDREWGDSTVRAEFLDDFVPKPDKAFTVTHHGKEFETVIEGDIDHHALIRAVLQEYFNR